MTSFISEPFISFSVLCNHVTCDLCDNDITSYPLPKSKIIKIKIKTKIMKEK